MNRRVHVHGIGPLGKTRVEFAKRTVSARKMKPLYATILDAKHLVQPNPFLT